MRTEQDHRRPEFTPGPSIRLADGGPWVFPSPVPQTVMDDRSYQAAIEAIREAETEPERQLAELVLGMLLLRLNYELTSSELRSLFLFESNDPVLANVQAELRDLANAHLAACRVVADPQSSILEPSQAHPRWNRRMA